jgi:signal transduction histidine kinase
VQFLSTTIDDFRNFFKPDKSAEMVPLNTPVEKALQIVGVSMKNKGTELETIFDSKDEVEIFQNETMQVILNILKNAEDNFVDKNISNPKIIITTSRKDNEFKITIQDNGGGIPEDIIGNIFDPYFSTKNEKNGTGLGLYMSKTIIEEHHDGRLSVSNQNDGACFEIVINN